MKNSTHYRLRALAGALLGGLIHTLMPRVHAMTTIPTTTPTPGRSLL